MTYTVTEGYIGGGEWVTSSTVEIIYLEYTDHGRVVAPPDMKGPPMSTITAEMATEMTDAELDESYNVLCIEWEYRQAAQNVELPEGCEVVYAGNSQEGDWKWCPQHNQWEAADGDEAAYWSFVLLARPKEKA